MCFKSHFVIKVSYLNYERLLYKDYNQEDYNQTVPLIKDK